MWGYICGHTRKTVDLSLSNLQKFAAVWVASLRDWFLLFEQQRQERIKKAIQLQSQKKT